jgi:hypothetical protein
MRVIVSRTAVASLLSAGDYFCTRKVLAVVAVCWPRHVGTRLRRTKLEFPVLCSIATGAARPASQRTRWNNAAGLKYTTDLEKFTVTDLTRRCSRGGTLA